MWLVEKNFLVENDFFPPSGFPPGHFVFKFSCGEFVTTFVEFVTISGEIVMTFVLLR